MIPADDLYAVVRDRQESLRQEAAREAPLTAAEEPVLTLPALALAWQVAELLERSC
jgi:hypothetical protein